jgi:DNA-directed RNA polymerase subunit RPC12/RpoP
MAKVVGFDEKQKKRVTCRGCSAIIEYVANEVKRRDGTDISGGPDGEEWVRCPNCGGRAIIRSW